MDKLKNIFKGDPVIWSVYFFLFIISLIEVYSAGSTLTYKDGIFWGPLMKQFVFLSIGFILMVFTAHIPCRMFRILPGTLLLLSYVLLGLTKIMGTVTNGAVRWMSIGGLQFQPSEIAKLAIALWVALILSISQQNGKANDRAYKLILIFTLPAIFLIALENASTAILLFIFILFMMVVGRIRTKLIIQLISIFAVIGGILVASFFILPKNSSIFQHGRLGTARARVVNLFEHKNISPEEYDIDKDAQIAHAKIAIASANFIGKMPGNSVERDFLSQAYSDFIYAIIIEETGIWGAVIVVFLYLILLFRANDIASKCERGFPAFVVLSLSLLLVLQALVNMIVAVGIGPVTGQPLPLISRGGTSILITSFYFGIILSVSRSSLKSKQSIDMFNGAYRNPGLIVEENN